MNRTQRQRGVKQESSQTQSRRSEQGQSLTQFKSQPSQRSTQNNSNFDVGELQMVLVKMVKLILNYSSNKIPFKRQDLVEKSLGGNGQIFKRVFELAKSKLNHIYGINVVEVASGKSTPPKFICVSNFVSASPMINTNKQNRQTTLLFIMLSYIFMKGGTITENTMMQFLKKFGIELDEDHSYLGNTKSTIELFHKQLYLVKEKFTQEGQNESIFNLSWGQRAESEISKKDLLETVAKLYNKPTVCFRKQHLEVYGVLQAQQPTNTQANNAEEPMETE